MRADSEAAYQSALRTYERIGEAAGIEPIPAGMDEDRQRLHVARTLGLPVTEIDRVPLRWVGIARLEMEIEAQRRAKRQER